MTTYWTELSTSRRIDVDRVVSGLHNVELLESMTKYKNRSGQYFPKVVESLRQLPGEYWDAALAVFGSVIYVPRDFMSATMQYLWWSVQTTALAEGEPLSQHGDDVFIMEVDQDGLVPDFARENGLSARLNGAIHPRLGDIQRLRFAMSQVLHGTETEREHAAGQLRLAADKRAWLVLTDKALSGQSLLGDVQKIAYARDLLAEASGNRPVIYVAAQIATATAEAVVNLWITEANIDGVRILSAIRLDERARVGSEACRLFDDQTHKMVLELCNWFDQEVVSKDLSLSTFRERSGGSLALGYKQTGITLVDSQNTPTNSLPLLWFNSEDPAARYSDVEPRPRYVAPFPRVHSRRGGEDPKWGETALWSDVLDVSSRPIILEGLGQ